MRSARGRRLVLVVAVLAVAAGVAAIARGMIERRFPRASRDWWRPVESAPILDPARIEAARVERRKLAEELAERRARLTPVPERLHGGEAVLQLDPIGPVEAAVFVGSDLVTVERGGPLRLWRPSPGRPLAYAERSLPAGGEGVALAAAGDRLWVAVPPDVLVGLHGRSYEEETVRFLPGCRPLGIVPADGDVRLAVPVEDPPGSGRFAVRHLAADLRPLADVPLRPPGPSVARAVAISSDGRRAALVIDSPGGSEAAILDAEDGRLLRRVVLPAGRDGAPPPPLVRVAFLPGTLALFSPGRVDLFADPPDADDGEVLPIGSPSAGVPAVEPCGDDLAVSPEGAVPVLVGRRAVPGPDGRRFELRALDLPPGARVLACADRGARIAAADPEGGLIVLAPGGSGRVPPGSSLAGVTVDPAGTRLRLFAAATSGGGLSEIDLRAIAGGPPVPADRPIAFDLSGGGAVFREEGGLRVRDFAGGERRLEAGDVRGVVLRDGVVAGVEGSFLVRWGDGAPERWALPAEVGEEPRVALGPRGARIVATGPGGFGLFRSGEREAAMLVASERYAGAPADPSPDGVHVAVVGRDNVLEIWSAEAREPVRSVPVFRYDAGEATALRYTPDGERLLVGSSRGTVAAWHVRAANAIWWKTPHRRPVVALAEAGPPGCVLSTDGRTAAFSASAGGDLLAVAAADLRGWSIVTPDGHYVAGGAAPGDWMAVVVRDGGERPVSVFGASDPDVRRLGDAVDAVRVTLIRTDEGDAAGDAGSR